jgi:hypothetical protein
VGATLAPFAATVAHSEAWIRAVTRSKGTTGSTASSLSTKLSRRCRCVAVTAR